MSAQDNAVRMKQDNTQTFDRTRQLIVFRLGEEEYGLSIGQIKEVVPTPVITRVPQAPPYVKGVANIRGNVIAMIDLEEKFGIKNGKEQAAATAQSNKYALVVESDDFKAGVLVKDVPNTLTISEKNIEAPSNLVYENQEQAACFQGIVKLEKRLIILIDIFAVIRQTEIIPMSVDSIVAS